MRYAFITLLGVLSFSCTVFGETLMVPEDYATVSEAVSHGYSGDVLSVAAGTYQEDLVFTGKDLLVKSRSNERDVVIQGSGTTFVVVAEEGSFIELSGLTITGGKGSNGAGVMVDGSSLTVRNSMIRNNAATFRGAGVYIKNTGELFLLDSEIENNSTVFWESCIYVGGQCKAVLERCMLRGNTTGIAGGCIYVGSQAQLYLANCLFVENQVKSSVVAHAVGGAVQAVNITCTNNLAASPRSFELASGSSLWLSNAILWNGGDEILSDATSTMTVQWSLIQNTAVSGEGILSADPLFVSPADGDYHLLEGSPCIDAGCGLDAPLLDYEGNGRWDDPDSANRSNCAVSWIDLGVFEYLDAPDPIEGLVCGKDGENRVVELSWDNRGPYESIEIRRDGVLLATIAGDAVSWDDTDPPTGSLTYYVLGQYDNESTPEVQCSITVGPRKITDFLCTQEGGDVLLSWRNNEAYDQIRMYRNGGALVDLEPDTTEYIDEGAASSNKKYDIEGVVQGLTSEQESCYFLVEDWPPSDLSCQVNDAAVSLGWIVGGAYTAIRIYLDGAQVAEIDGTADTYLLDLPAPGSHTASAAGVVSGEELESDPCTFVVEAPLAGISGLQCTREDYQTVRFSWTNQGQYDAVYIGTTDVILVELEGTATEHTLTTDSRGTVSYSVYAVKDGEPVDAMETCEVYTGVLPPVQLQCSHFKLLANFVWENGETYDRLELYRDSSIQQVLNGGNTAVSDELPEYGTYEYGLVAWIDGVSSEQVLCTIEAEGLTVPAPVAFTCTASEFTVSLAWTIPDGAAYDQLVLNRDGNFLKELSGDAVSTSDVVESAGQYEYVLEAVVEDRSSEQVPCTVTVENVVTLPPAPIEVSCTASDFDVSLSWSNPSGVVFDSIIFSRDGALIAELPGTAVTATDMVESAGTYEYALVGVVGEVSSEQATCTVTVEEVVTVPPAPIDVTCAASDLEISLSWTNPDDAAYDTIVLYRDGAPIAELPGASVSATDAVAGGGTYQYVLEGVAGGRASDPASCEVTAEEPAPAPPPPENLACSVSALAVSLSWTNPLDMAYDTIVLYRDGVSIAELPGASVAATDTVATSGTYEYVLEGVAADRVSDPVSCEVTAEEDLPPLSSLNCTVSGMDVFISWEYNEEGATVQIMCNDEMVAEVSSDLLSYEDEGLTEGQYTYSLYARKDGIVSDAVKCSVEVALPRIVLAPMEAGDDIEVEEPAFDVVLFAFELAAQESEGIVLSELVLTQTGDADAGKLSAVKLVVDEDEDGAYDPETDVMLAEGRFEEGKLVFDAFTLEIDASERVALLVAGDISDAEEAAAAGFTTRNSMFNMVMGLALLAVSLLLARSRLLRKAGLSLCLVLVMAGFYGCSDSSNHVPKSDPVGPVQPRVYYRFALQSEEDITVKGGTSGADAEIDGLPLVGHKTELVP